MNPRERFLAALTGRRPDRTPLAHVSALTTVELQEMTGCRMPEVHHDPERLVRLLASNHEILGFDAVSFIINYFNEPAALGCRMSWGAADQLPMYTSHPWARPEDAVIPADLLDRSPIGACRRAIRLAKQNYGDRIAVLGKVMGPLSMVQVMHGLDSTMMDMINEPEVVRRFLSVAADVLVKCGNAQFEAGADALAVGEGGAGSNMLSPKMHEEFLLPVHKRMIAGLRGPVIMHICGDIMPRLRLLKESGLTCFNFDWAIPPRVMRQAARDRFRIMGNVNTTDLLNGRPDEIARQVIEALEAGVDIISPGCAVSPKCPNANLLAMSKAIEKWSGQP